MFDPAVIGTTIIWLESERREADVERLGLAAPVAHRPRPDRLSRNLARWLRTAAERLEPSTNSTGATAA